MKCSVCGSDSNADARFCAYCGAKLNPGADTLFRPSAGAHPATAPSAPVEAGAATSVGPRTKNPLGPLLLLLAAVAIVGYGAYRTLIPDASTPGNAAVESPDRTAPSSEATKSVAAPTPSASKSATTEPAAAPPREALPGAQPPAAASKTPVAAAPRAASKTTAPRRRAASPAKARPPAKSVASPAPPPATAAAAPPPPMAAALPPAKPDSLMQLNDALARCVGQNLIRRAVCEQRARLQHCDGYWGQVAQCPNGTPKFPTN